VVLTQRGPTVSTIELILAMAGGIFTLRLAGLALAGATLPPALARGLGFVPIATLTALVVSSLVGRLDEGPTRLLAAVVAGLAAKRFGRAWVCILVGMAAYWLARFVTGGGS
jgi:branched-subunit amino acid transport protein